MINNNVRKLRNNLDMTQATFAEHCDISIISISRYESGERISARNAEKIANACHVSIEFVLGQEKQPSESNTPNTVEYDLSKEENQLIEDYRQISRRGQFHVRKLLNEIMILYPRGREEQAYMEEKL